MDKIKIPTIVDFLVENIEKEQDSIRNKVIANQLIDVKREYENKETKTQFEKKLFNLVLRLEQQKK